MAVDKIMGVTKGIVVSTDDPAGLHRVRVRIPQIHGCFDQTVYEAVNMENLKGVSWVEEKLLPWAEVNYPFGSDIPPEPNQVVLVSFLNGDPDKPIVLGWLGYEYSNKENPLQLDSEIG